MDYVDTSVLVAALVQEAHTRTAERWLTGGQELAISEWTITEISSALAVKLRTGSIDPETRAAAIDALCTMIAESLALLPLERTHFRTAAKFADQHLLGLRAPDALHLAVAQGNHATLVTLDKKLASAGQKLGVATRLL